MCEKKISTNHTYYPHMRSIILTLITKTKIFDQWISELNCDKIREYKLYNSLIQNTKIELLDSELKEELKQINIMDALDNNEYETAVHLIKQQKFNPFKVWQYVCEHNQQLNAIKLLEDFNIDYNNVTERGYEWIIDGMQK